MKFNVSELLAALSKIAPIVNKNSPIPILGDVKISIGKDLATLTGTNLTTEVSAVCPVEKAEPGDAACVSISKLMMALRTVQGGEITIKKASASGRGAQGHVYQLTSGNTKFLLTGRPPEDFAGIAPIAPTVAVSVNEGEFRQTIADVAYAMAQHDVRSYLNGVLIEASDTAVTVVASNGHRISKSVVGLKATLSTNDTLPMGSFGVILSQEVVRGLLLRALDPNGGEMRIRVSPTLVEFETASLRFTSVLLEGRYPAYQRVIPTTTGITLQVHRDSLLTMATRADILLSDAKDGVRVQLKLQRNTLIMSAKTPQGESYVESLDIEYDGPNFAATYNVNYLIDALRNRDDDVLTLGLDATDAHRDTRALFKSASKDGFAAVIMSMRDETTAATPATREAVAA